MVDIVGLLFKKPTDSGFRIGFVAVFLISIAFAFLGFYGLGYDNPQITAYKWMLVIGLVMTIFLSMVYSNQTRTQAKFRGMTPNVVQKQMSVIVMGVFSGIVLVIVNASTNVGSNILLGSIADGTVPMELIFLGVMAGVAEELFFRGFIQTWIRIYVPSLVLAVVPASLAFALYHYFAYSNPATFLTIFALGLFLGTLHELTNDIGVPMLAHVVNNIFAMFGIISALLLDNFVVLAVVIGLTLAVYFRASNARRRK